MVAKAVIPVAGLGARLRPLSSVLSKALLPLYDGRRLRPVVHYVCAEAFSAGAEQVALIVPPGQEELFRTYFAAAGQAGDRDLPGGIEYIPAAPLGFGYAVAQARTFVGDRPFLVLLGDHVHLAEEGRPTCAAQVASAFAGQGGAAMIGVQVVDGSALCSVGAAAGRPVGRDLYLCTAFAEKPALALARKTLTTPGLGEDRFLAHCGIYLFAGEMFDCLAEVAAGLPAGRELALADAQGLLLKRRPRDYYLLKVAGRALDVGTPAAYAQAWEAMRTGPRST